MLSRRWLGAVLMVSIGLGACSTVGNNNGRPSNTQQPGAQMDKKSAPISIDREGDGFYLTHGSVTVEVVPQVGGRIASIQYEGRELLLERRQGSAWGNVLWPSPQSDWGWPPAAALDRDAYQVVQGDNWLTLTSGIDSETGYQFIKSYHFDQDTGALVLDYEIHNRGSRDHWVAPWEVTRVPPEGLAFFPSGKTDSINGMFERLPVETEQGITWYAYDPELIKGNHKLMTDGAEGWLAYVNDGLALIKQFADVPAALNAPGEGEIELFTDSEKTLIEVEQQGPLSHLAPGDSLNWQVRWHIKPVPDHLAPEVGNSDLVAWVRSSLGETDQ